MIPQTCPHCNVLLYKKKLGSQRNDWSADQCPVFTWNTMIPLTPNNYPLPCHVPRHLIFATRSPRTNTSDLHYTSLPRLDSRVWNEDRVLIRKLKHFIAFGLWRHPRLLHSGEGNTPFRGKQRGLPQQDSCSPTPWRMEESKCITYTVDS